MRRSGRLEWLCSSAVFKCVFFFRFKFIFNFYVYASKVSKNIRQTESFYYRKTKALKVSFKSFDLEFERNKSFCELWVLKLGLKTNRLSAQKILKKLIKILPKYKKYSDKNEPGLARFKCVSKWLFFSCACGKLKIAEYTLSFLIRNCM